jgi:hypothetical protein
MAPPVRRVVSTTLLALASCSSSPPPRTATPEEARKLYPDLEVARTVTITKAEPPPGCAPLGTVTSEGAGWGADAHYFQLQRNTAHMGGNYVVMDLAAQGLVGRAFRCAPPSGGAATGRAPASAACEPACSPGYTCLRGQCVSACNPACNTGDVCGADRICRPAPAQGAL